MQRCDWVSQDPLYIAYHDNEWGVPEPIAESCLK
ncbi:3-methyl-adenine DNA glycosylase I, constitutive [Salmonella enterica subsp. enterica]|nr:3-methyl-adenine DNA glycosylase I, constitutive [Salmonella enterica subsp. enterica]